jgi:hypothetical protein
VQLAQQTETALLIAKKAGAPAKRLQADRIERGGLGRTRPA